MNNAVYGLGFTGAFVGISKANQILQGKTPGSQIDAAVYLAESAGELMGTAASAHQLGVDHIYGIGMRLNEIAMMTAHSNKYSSAQIRENEVFVNTVLTSFQSSWDAQINNYSKSKLYSAIEKIYDAMNQPERSQLYPLY